MDLGFAGGVGSFEGPDVSGDVVAEDVFPGETWDVGAAVDEASGDGVALELAVAAGVVPDGWVVGGIGAAGSIDGAVELGAAEVPFIPGPAVIASDEGDGDFFAGALADVADPEFVVIETEAPGVAEADGEELGAGLGGVDGDAIEGGGADPGVVGGDFVERVAVDELDGGVGVGAEVGVVVSGAVGRGVVFRFEVDIDAGDRGPEILIEELAVVEGVIGGALVSPAHVEVAIGAEVEVAAVVVSGVVSLFDEDFFGGGIGGGVGEVGIVPAGEALVVGAAGADVVDDEKGAVVLVVGVEGDAEEALFAAGEEGLAAGGEDLIEVEENGFGGVGGGDVGDEFEVAGLLADEEALGVAIGAAEAEGGREGEAGEGGLDFDDGRGRLAWESDGGVGDAWSGACCEGGGKGEKCDGMAGHCW